VNKLNPVKITADLIKCPSVTPVEGGALVLIDELLSKAGFYCTRIDRNGISNLFARWGDPESGSTFCFSGHTDVVPPGDINSWSFHPFSGDEKAGYLYGRGATDMKSAVAAFISAAVNYVETSPPTGSIVLAITGDEEGEAKDGTLAILKWMEENNERINHCLVGEPTSKNLLGDTLKIGRRGSLTAKFTVIGLQGHVAYPEKAINPIPSLTKLLLELSKKPLDKGSTHFDPSSLVITTIDTGNSTNNVIPEKTNATINIRFNNLHSAKSLTAWLRRKANKVSKDFGVQIKIEESISAQPFICEPGKLSTLVVDAIKTELKIDPILSTSGGTSDARFIQKYCPVVEFGLVGTSMHKTDEHVEIKQIHNLERVYYKVLKEYFKN